MTVIQLLKENTNKAASITAEQTGEPLCESVRQALKNYFGQLKGEEPQGVYKMVLTEVEVPLLETVMKSTRNNQSLTARILGLSRGNLREKLKAYGILMTD